MGRGGGLLICPANSVEPEVPWENIVAMYEAAEEFGDFLFSVVNIARYLKIQPEDALRSTNDKFIRRFAHVERRLRETDRDIVETDLETLDRYWEEAKGIDSE